MGRAIAPKIKKETISTYSAHSENGEFVIEHLSSLMVYEYDDKALLWKSSLQRFDNEGSLSESALTKRRPHEKGYIYERYNHYGELEGYIICNKNGSELETTILGHHSTMYNEEGKLLSHKSVYSDGDTQEFIYTYDESGNLIQTVETLNGKSTILNHYRSEDLLGNIVETSLNAEGHLVRSEVIDKTTGQTLEIKEMREDDHRSYDVTYYRNNLNNSYYARVTNSQITHNTYRTLEYDKYDNWILELVANNVYGEPQYYIRVRDINYDNRNALFGEFDDI